MNIPFVMKISSKGVNSTKIVEMRLLRGLFSISKRKVQSTLHVSSESQSNKATPVTVSFDQSQASFWTENLEFDAYVGNPAQCRNVNYYFGTNHSPQSDTATPRDIDASRLRQTYRELRYHNIVPYFAMFFFCGFGSQNDIRVVNKPLKTLHQEFPCPKFRQPSDLQCNVVYKIPRKDCP